VLIDTGPVLSVSDSAIVAQKTDGMLLVVRPSNASREQAEDSAARLRGVGANLLGCVLNTFGSGSEFAGGGGYYGYYASPTENGSARPRTAASRNGAGSSKTETLAR
jgi:Mrp family chromosome partitioning ATPase